MSGATASGAPPAGVLVMAHGTPTRRDEIAPFYTRIRRGRPPSAAELAELEDRYAAIGGLSPLAERHAGPGGRRAGGAGAARRPAATPWPTGRSTPRP